MDNVIALVPGPVAPLWSPSKRTRASWRLSSTSSVVPFQRRDPVEWGDYWHALCARLMAKYGADWKYRYGFNLNQCTNEERQELDTVYARMIAARKQKNA